ncbi:uncharacterized protein LOC111373523 [Olea europaea var. sylvestris]|uniref:uncharacterized protein LOC111373523 n=1 Tax=Olea europaea var. sylvestris TaxID=158386 RepID=UPI000C1D7559|nr:uncharacterized protein LOC111373523 [Olea europaea var. sylvestris]
MEGDAKSPRKSGLEALQVDSIETHMTNLGATVKNSEVQISQIATAIQSQQKEQFPVTQRLTHRNTAMLSPYEVTEGQKTEAEATKKIYKPYSISFPENPPILKPPLPFPQRYLKKEFDEKFEKFLEVFKKIHINIPFVETLAQMPNYAKFLKEVISKKRKLEEFETVKLIEECSAILQKKLPHKSKDLGSFNIRCNFGGITFDRALCDLGASINLIPLSVSKKLGLGKVNPAILTLQLANRSITYPKGIIEDVLVKVDKFIFLVDFVVLDMRRMRKYH